MAKLNIVNLKGEKTSDIKLNDSVWNIETNEIVLKQAIDKYLASLRQGTHKTKTRGEVSGGGRKPYRQKGTGNARQGTIRAPHYRGGGVVFGVTPRSYTFKTNRKERGLALRSALSDKVKNNEVVVVDSLEINDIKTKTVKNMIVDLKLAGKVLFVTANEGENLYMAARNLGYVDVVMANEINVYNIINADTIVFESEAVKNIEEVLK